MAIDWSGRKYRVLQALGENIDMICGVYQPACGQMRWFLHSHELDDGGGAMVKILANMGVIIQPRQRKHRSGKPSLLTQLAALRLHIRNSRPVDYPWRQMSATPAPAEACFVYLLLPPAHSEQIRLHTRAQGVGETALFLASLDKVTRERCLAQACERVWLLPHDVRRALGVSAQSGNWTAPVSLRVNQAPTAQAIYGQLKTLYGQRILWGSWLYTNFARWLSEGMIRRAYMRIKGRAWFGVYANMGHWRAPAADAGRLPGAWIVSAPPVSAICPVTAGSFTWDGRTGLTLQLHTSLGADHATCMAVMRDWAADLCREAGITEAAPEPQGIAMADIQRQASRVDISPNKALSS